MEAHVSMSYVIRFIDSFFSCTLRSENKGKSIYIFVYAQVFGFFTWPREFRLSGEDLNLCGD